MSSILSQLASSRTAAAYTIYGALLGGLFAMMLGLPLNMVNIVGNNNMTYITYILTLVITSYSCVNKTDKKI